jgi:hypothetical protein
MAYLQVAAQEGRLLFMTTNHIERLAPALIRPGRVDVRCAFGAATRQQAHDLFVSFYADMPPSAAAAAAPGMTEAGKAGEVVAAETGQPAKDGMDSEQVASASSSAAAAAAAPISNQKQTDGAVPSPPAAAAAAATLLTRQELLRLAQRFAAALPVEELGPESPSSSGYPAPVVDVSNPAVPGRADVVQAAAEAPTLGQQTEHSAGVSVAGVIAGISMAALQGHLMSYKRDPWGAVAHADQLARAGAGRKQGAAVV